MDTRNYKCKCYPCHDENELESCTFCFCPIYPCNTNRGVWIENGFLGEPILDCSKCTWPHKKELVDKFFNIIKREY
jgi:Zn-finger protein